MKASSHCSLGPRIRRPSGFLLQRGQAICLSVKLKLCSLFCVFSLKTTFHVTIDLLLGCHLFLK